MKTTVNIPTEIEIDRIRVVLAVRYGDEDMPFDFPLRHGETWTATIFIDTGKILDWPQGRSAEIYMKVCDEGCYYLMDKDGVQIAARESEYVPHGIVPGEYGDYVNLKINAEGIITNWPKNPDVSKFFEQE